MDSEAFLSGFINIRLNARILSKIYEHVADFPDTYDSPSHFIRCAINRELARDKETFK